MLSDASSSVSDATAMPYSPDMLSVPVTMALMISPSSAAVRSVSLNMESWVILSFIVFSFSYGVNTSSPRVSTSPVSEFSAVSTAVAMVCNKSERTILSSVLLLVPSKLSLAKLSFECEVSSSSSISTDMLAPL